MAIAARRYQLLIISWLAAVLVVALPGCGGAAGGRAGAAVKQDAPPARPAIAYDHDLTDVARVLAGLDPEDAQRFAAVTSRPAWKAHKAAFDTNWSQIEQQRFTVMRAWRDRELKPVVDGCDVLFYPFGGPDFINAHLFNPTCQTYLLFGLEPTGSVLRLDKLTPEKADRALGEIREALSDIFKRGYLITQTMEKELRTPQVDGTLPMMMVFLARLDARIVSIEFGGSSPWDPTAPAPTRAGRLPSVTVAFVAKDSDRIQKVSYIRVDMMNPGFSQRATLLAYLKGLGPVTTFVKSASYLMHDDRFSMVRDIVLTQSKALLQDDTGVPFHFLDPAKWTLTFYGKYSPPISDFKYGFQKDLDAVFKQPGTARELPFTFGYHWQQGTSSVILAVRKPAGQ